MRRHQFDWQPHVSERDFPQAAWKFSHWVSNFLSRQPPPWNQPARWNLPTLRFFVFFRAHKSCILRRRVLITPCRGVARKLVGMHGIRRSCDSGFREAIIQIGATVTGRGPACREQEREASRRFMRKKYFLPPAPRPVGLRESDELEPSKSDSLGNNCGVKAASRDSLWGSSILNCSATFKNRWWILIFPQDVQTGRSWRWSCHLWTKCWKEQRKHPEFQRKRSEIATRHLSDGTFLESVGFISRHPS